jgi:carbon monoxide dehydrogenase subunit G
MARWTTCTTIDGEPERVLDVLTDPDACRRWAPVDFEVESRTARLQAGLQTRVAGRVAGREVGFDVRTLESDARRLVLHATGPVHIEARYDAVPEGRRTKLCASIAVRNAGGLIGRVLSGATDALLAAGALDQAMARIAGEVETAAPAALAA